MGVLAWVLALVYLWVFGPSRTDRLGDYDFRVLYAGAKAFRLGLDPYDPTPFTELVTDPGAKAVHIPIQTTTPLLFAMLSPLTVLSFGVAQKVWLASQFVWMGVILWQLMGGLGLGWRDWRVPWMGAMSFALAPMVTAVSVGQVVPLLIALMVLSWRQMDRRPGLAGVLIGLATAIKPTSAIGLIFYPAIRRQWRAVVGAVVSLGVIGATSLAVLHIRSPGWQRTWRGNLDVFVNGGQGDPLGSLGHQFINLQRPLRLLLSDHQLVEVIIWLMVGIPAVVLGVRMWRDRRGDLMLLDVSLIAVASLLVVYHRAYDALVVVMPLALALGRLRELGWWAWVIIGVVLSYMVPFSALFIRAGQGGIIPGQWLNEPWFSATIWAATSWMGLVLFWVLTALRLFGASRVAGPPRASDS